MSEFIQGRREQVAWELTNLICSLGQTKKSPRMVQQQLGGVPPLDLEEDGIADMLEESNKRVEALNGGPSR